MSSRLLLNAGLLLLILAGSLPAYSSEPVIITVYASQSSGAYKPVWNYFGADEPNYVYTLNGEKLLRELAAMSPVPIYFRTHNLLTTGNGQASLKWGSTNVYTERPDGTPIYDWTITDKIFDAFKRSGVRPLVEVGFMPEALSTHPQPYRHTFPKEGAEGVFTGWSYPPRDYDKWSALISAWVQHLSERYGKDVNGWLWEVWNEPDIPYWHGTAGEYNHLYDVTTAAIRRVLPSAKVGGPESTGPSTGNSAAFLRQFLEHCAHGKNTATGRTGAPLDFISFHPKGNPKIVDGHVRMSLATQLQKVDLGMEIVASFPKWKNTPIILGESDPEGCAACKGSQNSYREGPLYSVSVTEATVRTYELARKHNVNLEGIVTWAFEFEDEAYFAGFRELATNGVDKAVLNAFRISGMLGGNWLRVESTGAQPLEGILKGSVLGPPDINAVATRKPRELNILVWNYHDDDVNAPAAQVEIRIQDLPVKVARMERFLIDEGHSNAYAVWMKMGSPQHPTAVQQQELEKSGMLESVEPSMLDRSSGVVKFSLARQGITLVHLTW